MATYTVTTLADSGAGSLRQAILDANASVGVVDTINFSASITGGTTAGVDDGVIVLTGTHLSITDDLIIDGDTGTDDKADITLDGGGNSRIFDIAAAGTDADLFSLTLTNGNAVNGGAISAAEGTTLDVVNSTISGNTATEDGGGVFLDDDLISSLSTTARFFNSTLSGNTAGDNGGAIADDFHLDSTLLLVNTTIDGNTATFDDAIDGIQIDNFTVLNSTIVGGLSGTVDLARNSFFSDFVSTGSESNIIKGGDVSLLEALADNGGTVQTRAPKVNSGLIAAGDASLLPADEFDLDNDGNTAEPLPVAANGGARVQSGLDIGAAETDLPAYVVDTLVDENDADYSAGDLSLREALFLAPDGATIGFDAALTGGTIRLANELFINDEVTIDGDINDDGTEDITISGDTDGDGTGDTLLFRVFSIGDATLTGLILRDGAETGVSGGGGYNHDAAGAILNRGTLTVTDSSIIGNSGVGVDNTGVPTDGDAGYAGGDAAGGILNFGTATITDVRFEGNSATGGTGSVGGYGFYGPDNGGDGGVGGMGGSAGSDILNASGATLTLDGVTVSGGTQTGGMGGMGGGGASASVGDGGDGGDGGMGGDGGHAAAVLNKGMASGSMAYGPSTSTYGTEGASGAGGMGDGAGSNGTGSGTGAPGNGSQGFYNVSGLGTGSVTSDPLVVIVDTLTDENDSDFSAGDLSLREAIGLVAENGRIEFDAAITGGTTAGVNDGVITLGFLGELAIAQGVAIDGDVDGDLKADITLSGNDQHRLFNISAGDVELRSLDIAEGKVSGFTDSGGAVFAADGASLKIVNSTIRDSEASVIDAGFGGGGIRAQTLTVANSTFSGNIAGGTEGVGGGVLIAQNGSGDFDNVTFSGNSSNKFGGGIYAAQNVDLTIRNSTITENNAQSKGGGVLFDEFLTDVIVHNTILSDNTAGIDHDDAGRAYAGGSSSISAANSLLGTGITLSTSFLGPGADIDNIRSNNPMLDALVDNGGPVDTRALQLTSAAISQGDAGLLVADALDVDDDGDTAELLPIDANGRTRALGQLDIGAVEAVFDTVTVDTLEDTQDGDVSTGDISLREALDLVKEGGRIEFDAALDNQTIQLASVLTIATGRGVTIDGDIDDDGNPDITVSGDTDGNGTGDTRILNVEAGAIAVLDGLILTKGHESGANAVGVGNPGGIGVGTILNHGNLTLISTAITEGYGSGGSGSGGGQGSGNGSNGGGGGDGVGGVLNRGVLTVIGGVLTANQGKGGAGGVGGQSYMATGFHGGDGGNGANDILNDGALFLDGAYFYAGSPSRSAIGGEGGDGGPNFATGDGGDGGNGGYASGSILNAGFVYGRAKIVGGYHMTYNGGDGGAAGTGGNPGQAGIARTGSDGNLTVGLGLNTADLVIAGNSVDPINRLDGGDGDDVLFGDGDTGQRIDYKGVAFVAKIAASTNNSIANALDVTDGFGRIATDPNITDSDTAGVVTIDAVASTVGQTDFYKFEIFEGGRVTLDIDMTGGGLDTVMNLYDESSTRIFQSDDTNPADPGSGTTLDSMLSEILDAGTYYVEIGDFLGGSVGDRTVEPLAPAHSYKLHITAPARNTNIQPDPREGFQDILRGGAGDDLLRGQAGDDIFVYERFGDADTITDFGVTYFSLDMDGSQEVPSNGSTATGTGFATVNHARDTLNVDFSTTGIDLDVNSPGTGSILTGLHIHNAPAGSNGGVVFNILSDADTVVDTGASRVTTEWTGADGFDAVDLSELMAGNHYVNLHTTSFGGGEIRGQLERQGMGRDLIDLTALNIGGFEALQALMVDFFGIETHIGTFFDGMVSSLVLENVVAGDLTAADFIFGGAGVQVIHGTANDDDLFGGDDDDTLNGGGGPDRLFGERGSDTVNGEGGDDFLYVTVSDPGDLDTLDGGADTDTANFAYFEDAVWVDLDYTLPSGIEAWTRDNATVTSGTWRGIAHLENIENVEGSAFDDEFYGDAGNNRFTAGEGNDTFYLEAGFDEFFGQDGTDTADFSLYQNAVWVDLTYAPASGIEAWTTGGPTINNVTWQSVANLEKVENLVGSDFDDEFYDDVNANNDYDVGEGNDKVFLAGGFDNSDGGDGKDRVDFSEYASAIWIDLSYTGITGFEAWTTGGASIDFVNWQQIANLTDFEDITGSNFDDIFYGDAGDNDFSGGGGNDRFFIEAGFDDVDGGDNTDNADFSAYQFAVWVDLSYAGPTGFEAWTRGGTDVDSGTWQAIADLTNVEDLTGSAFDDKLYGDAEANSFSALAGNDLMVGEAGDDTFVHQNGFDTVDGGGDSDTSDFSQYQFAIWVDLSYTGATGFEAWTRGGTTVDSGAWQAIADLTNVENITGSVFDDQFYGDAANNAFSGGAGDDRFFIEEGLDEIDGGGDTDTVDFSLHQFAVWVDLDYEARGNATGFEAWTRGGPTVTTGTWQALAEIANAENLVGSVFDDHLMGDAANNRLTGNNGNDTFAFKDGFGTDTIVGFQDTGSGFEDVLNFSESSSINAFTDITSITVVSGNTEVATAQGTIVLEGVTSGIATDDFVF